VKIRNLSYLLGSAVDLEEKVKTEISFYEMDVAPPYTCTQNDSSGHARLPL
jgi:hypothetical protein